jgi:hypothetical protein
MIEAGELPTLAAGTSGKRIGRTALLLLSAGIPVAEIPATIKALGPEGIAQLSTGPDREGEVRR